MGNKLQKKKKKSVVHLRRKKERIYHFYTHTTLFFFFTLSFSFSTVINSHFRSHITYIHTYKDTFCKDYKFFLFYIYIYIYITWKQVVRELIKQF